MRTCTSAELMDFASGADLRTSTRYSRRAVHRLLAQDLDLEQDRLLPIGLLHERTVDRLQRDRGRLEIDKPRVVGGERNGELRLGVVRIGLGQRLHELQRGRLVRLGGECPVELEEGFAQSGPGRGRLGQRPFEVRLEVCATNVAAAFESRDDLLGAVGRRIELRPQRGGVQGERALARGECDLRCSTGESGVARFARHVVVGARGQRRFTPLQRDVADEQPVHELRGELARLGGRRPALGIPRATGLGRPIGGDDDQCRERRDAH